MNKRLKELDYKARSKAVLAGDETSPSRRAALNTFFDTKEDLVALNRSVIFEECHRAFELLVGMRIHMIGICPTGNEHMELGHHSSHEVGRQAPGEHAGQRALP